MSELVNRWMNVWINEWGFSPPLCTYRLNWVRRTSWGWWDEWDGTALQISKFEPWGSVSDLSTSRSLRLSTILNHYEWAGRKHSVSLKLASLNLGCQRGVQTRDLGLPSRQLHLGPRSSKKKTATKQYSYPENTRHSPIGPMSVQC